MGLHAVASRVTFKEYQAQKKVVHYIACIAVFVFVSAVVPAYGARVVC